jgi:multiple sugar transport system permease protein
MATVVVTAPTATRGFEDQRRRFYDLMLLPALGALVVVTLLPTLYLLAVSFTPMDLTRPGTAWDFSSPFAQYVFAWNDSRLHNSLWIQAKLSFWSVACQVLLGLLFALLLNTSSKILLALRTVVAIIWKVIYTPDISPMHWALEAMGFPIRSLITNPDWALTAIIIADVWEWFPFVMLMVLASLQMMPQEYVEAAKVDGASVWQLTFYVTLPHLKGVLLVAALFRLVDSIKAFPLIYILTDGGPGTVTEVTNYYSFKQAFNFSYLGYSSAITIVLVTITVLLSWAIIRMVGWGQRVD